MQQKTGKSTFFAFFQAKGKAEEIRAILSEQEQGISLFDSADKAQKQPSRAETKQMKNQCRMKKMRSCNSSSLGVLQPSTPLLWASVLRISLKICMTFTPE